MRFWALGEFWTSDEPWRPKSFTDFKASIMHHKLNISKHTFRSIVEKAILQHQMVADNDGHGAEHVLLQSKLYK